MAIAIDASSPIRWTGTPADTVNITSASFTAPSGALLVCCVNGDETDNDISITIVVADSGGLTWTQRIIRDDGSPAGTALVGHASIFTATTVSEVARTVTVQRSAGAGGSNRLSAKLYVVTGQHASPIGATGEGSLSANDSSPTIFTSTGENSFAFVAVTDWNQLGVIASSDLTEESADYSSQISVMSGYKDCGASGSESANINFGGTGTAEANWVALEILAAAAVAGNANLLHGKFGMKLVGKL